MISVLLTGWSGQAWAMSGGGSLGEPVQPSATRRVSEEIGYAVRREDERVVLTAVSTDFAIRKVVSADGHTTALVEHGKDVVSIAGTSRMIVIGRGGRSVTVTVSGGHEAQLARVRALFLGSPAIQSLRRLAVVLEESGTDAPEKMGIRLTGALIAQMDGDEGAVRRLSRELHARYGGHSSRTADRRPDAGRTYRAGVLRAADHLEDALSSFYLHNPMRQVCSFVWMLQVETLWFEYVGRSGARFH